jgi:hypothetical protein
VLLMIGLAMRARAAEPEPPSKDFLEYLGTLEAEDDDWTIFASTRAPADEKDPPRPPKKEKSPTPPTGDEP